MLKQFYFLIFKRNPLVETVSRATRFTFDGSQLGLLIRACLYLLMGHEEFSLPLQSRCIS